MGLDQRADVQFLGKMVGVAGKSLDHSKLVSISEDFVAQGGSWEGIFRGGSPEQMTLLRKILMEKLSEKKAKPDSKRS